MVPRMSPGEEITVYDEFPYRLREAAWQMYLDCFEPMRTLAAQRHVMFREEWNELMNDTSISKILAHSGDTPQGLACVTNQLKSIPLVEPEYFAALEPKLYEAGHVWYTAFVCVRQTHPRPPKNTFQRLIEKVAEPIRPVRGVCYMDYATVRVNQGLPRASNILLMLGNEEATYEQVDAQTYWAYYPGGRPL
jgi:hypothetical protein